MQHVYLVCTVLVLRFFFVNILFYNKTGRHDGAHLNIKQGHKDFCKQRQLQKRAGRSPVKAQY